MSNTERECSKCFRKGIDTMSCPLLDCPYSFKFKLTPKQEQRLNNINKNLIAIRIEHNYQKYIQSTKNKSK